MIMTRKFKAMSCLFSGAALLGASLFIAYAGYWETRININAQNWAAASTTITYTYSIRTAERSRIGIDSVTGTEYVLSPSYTFQARDGKEYSGNVYSTFGDKILRTYSEDTLKPYLIEIGNVYYDPEDPHRSSVIKPHFDMIALFVFTSFLILSFSLAFWLTKYGIRLLKPHKK